MPQQSIYRFVYEASPTRQEKDPAAFQRERQAMLNNFATSVAVKFRNLSGRKLGLWYMATPLTCCSWPPRAVC